MNKETFIKGFVDLLSTVLEEELNTQSKKKEEETNKEEKKFIEVPQEIKIHHVRLSFETDEESNLAEDQDIFIDYPQNTSTAWNTILSDEAVEETILEEGVYKFLQSFVKQLNPSTKYIMDINLAIDVTTALRGNLEVFCIDKPIISRK